MMQLRNVFIIFSVLFTTASSTKTCNSEGTCTMDDETSLMQVKHAVKSGRERETTNSNANEATYEIVEEDLDDRHGALADTEEVEELLPSSPPITLPAGCRGRALCIGSAPWCGATKENCRKKNGRKVIGWRRRCVGSYWTCLSGWKVICAQCGSSFADVAYPAPLPLVAKWVMPVVKPAPTPAPATVKTVNIPKFAMPAFTYTYNNGAVGNATAGFNSAWKNLTQFKANVCNTTTLIKQIQANVTLFRQKERKYAMSAKKSRTAAVKFAKKGVLSNITLMKAKRAMDGAYTAQIGSTNRALQMTAVATNARLQKVYYRKKLIDKKEELREANRALRIAKIAVNTAAANFRRTKNLAQQRRGQRNFGRLGSRLVARKNLKIAQDLAVKKQMEEAYAAASPLYGPGQDLKRTVNTVPSYGRNAWGVTGLNSAPSCQCAGLPGCQCASWAKAVPGPGYVPA